MSRLEHSTVAPCRTAAPETPPVAAVRAAMAGSSSPEKSSILAMVSRPRPTITVMSLTVRAVTARAPAISTAWSPPDRPSRQAPSARPHSRTTAISFSPRRRLRRISPSSCAPAALKMLLAPASRPSVPSTPYPSASSSSSST